MYATCSAQDLFRIHSQPSYRHLQLDVYASFFEIYSGKVSNNVIYMFMLTLVREPECDLQMQIFCTFIGFT